jgi:hypothetical protein
MTCRFSPSRWFTLFLSLILLGAQQCTLNLKLPWRLPPRPPSRGALIQPSLWEEPHPRSQTDEAFLVAPEILTSRTEVLRKGSSGPRVAIVQEFLRRAQLYDGEITGYFDDETEKAIKKFQGAFGLRPDGRIGWKTAEMIRKVMRGEIQ